jgi:hypothetical protein
MKWKPVSFDFNGISALVEENDELTIVLTNEELMKHTLELMSIVHLTRVMRRAMKSFKRVKKH